MLVSPIMREPVLHRTYAENDCRYNRLGPTLENRRTKVVHTAHRTTVCTLQVLCATYVVLEWHPQSAPLCKRALVRYS